MPYSVSLRRRSTPELNCLNQRVKALRQKLEGWGVNALLVTNPRDIRYLTGFQGDDSWAVVSGRSNKVVVISDFRFQEQIQREAGQVAVRIRKKGLSDELAAWMERAKCGRIGLQADYVSLSQRKALAKKVGASRLVAVEDGLLGLRAVKDEPEVRAIQRALKIQQRAFREVVGTIQPGQTERQIAAELEYRMRLLGADGPSFPTIVAVDANASLPHAVPGDRKVKKNSCVLIDWGARWGGYCSDLTRVVAVGKMPPKMREIYQVVLEAQEAAIAAIGPGKRCSEIDAVARRVIDRAGYGKAFGHSLGHGLGLDIHELPTLSGRSDAQLKPGHVVTVEPGIYLPGVGGVRIEDDVLVTEKGHRVLSDLPKGLKSANIGSLGL